MNAERKQAIESVLQMIREDIEADITSYEGKPFDGELVGEAFGNLAAQVDALAHVLQALIAEVRPS